jgi:hypothetical protein
VRASTRRAEEVVVLVPFLVLALVFAVVYLIVIRPWGLNWGATDDERQAALPGDELVADARYVTTRGITIAAPPAAVWPWLVQMGQDRGGFYTHNWVERLLRSGIPDVHEVHPEWQLLEPGALMRTNHDIGGKPMGWPVAIVEPGRALVVRSTSLPRGSYAFVLRPLDERRTRLLVRDRAAWKRIELPFAVVVYEPLHAYMETGLLRGIRERVEERGTSSGAPSAIG